MGVAAGDVVRVIAARLGRAPSTVSREIRRNCLCRGRYRAVAAQGQAEFRAARPKAGAPRLWLRLSFAADRLSAL